ncbi:MAG: cysteine desulfurase [Clostridia bacterium]|nr:cysteine desulfurase [Clostridia bacterium]
MQKTIYLDNSATTPVFEVVALHMLDAMQNCYFNPSAAYGPAVKVERELQACRETLRKAAGAQGYEVIFTSGGTEANNLAILGVLERQRLLGTCCFSAVEHPAVREPMRAAEGLGHQVRMLPVDAQGVLDLERCAAMLDAGVSLISCMHVCNETGAVQPIEALAALRNQRCPSALLHVDGVQGFLRAPLSVGRIGVDLYTISGHKIHGPKGIGALLARKGIKLHPQLLGGGQEGGLRSGTENVPGILGLQTAAETLRAMPDLDQTLRSNKMRLLHRVMAGEPQTKINGPDPESPQAAPHILNLSLPGVRGEVLLHALEAVGVYVSTGSACSARKQRHGPALEAMGITGDRLEGAIRISLSPLNTSEEMGLAADAILAAHAQLKGFKRR